MIANILYWFNQFNVATLW